VLDVVQGDLHDHARLSVLCLPSVVLGDEHEVSVGQRHVHDLAALVLANRLVAPKPDTIRFLGSGELRTEPLSLPGQADVNVEVVRFVSALASTSTIREHDQQFSAAECLVAEADLASLLKH
jgi:hypothetical protein